MKCCHSQFTPLKVCIEEKSIARSFLTTVHFQNSGGMVLFQAITTLDGGNFFPDLSSLSQNMFSVAVIDFIGSDEN